MKHTGFHIGFTGSSHGMTDKQWDTVYHLLVDDYHKGDMYLHHGGCVGADKQAHDIAVSMGYKPIVYPGHLPDKWADLDYVYEEHDIKNTLDRNRDIVNAAQLMIATPKESKEIQRSGTWATIRYAKSKKKPLIIVWPNGRKKFFNVKEGDL